MTLSKNNLKMYNLYAKIYYYSLLLLLLLLFVFQFPHSFIYIFILFYATPMTPL